MQSGYRNGIWHRKMCHVHNMKWEKTNNGRDKTVKSRKSQEKRKLTNTWVYWNRT